MQYVISADYTKLSKENLGMQLTINLKDNHTIEVKNDKKHCDYRYFH